MPFELIGYANSNYAGDPKNRKLVMGYYFFIHRALVSQCNKKQHIISTSTTKAEYIILGHAACESVQIRQFLNKLEIADLISACVLHGDNETSIILTKNAKSQARTKHINMQYHYIRELIADKKVIIEQICNTSMLVDGFTKALSVDSFRQYKNLFSMSLQQREKSKKRPKVKPEKKFKK